MYISKHFAQTDTGSMHKLIQVHPLATWVTQYADGDMIIDHIPFILDPNRGEFGTLIGHISKANPLWKKFHTSTQSVCVFHGVEGYISPNWYVESRAEHGKVVPTWNYATVHAYGQPKVIEGSEALYELLRITTERFESRLPEVWTMQDAPEDYIRKMLKAIIGVEIPITQLIGKFKLNQNKKEADRAGVVAALMAQGNSESKHMAAIIKQTLRPAHNEIDDKIEK